MRSYFDLLQKISSVGYLIKENNRKIIINESIRFNLMNGFPTITTNNISTKVIIEELLWMITGSTNIKDLNDVDVHTWDHLAVTANHIEESTKGNKEVPSDDLEAIKKELISQLVGEIGPMHGHNWRNAPSNPMTVFVPPIDVKDIPVVKLNQFKEAYEDYKRSNPNDSIIDMDAFCSMLYRQTRDQLNELLISLRDNPFTGRHVVMSAIPGILSYDKIPPYANVLAGNGAFAATDVMFQCMVIPAVYANNKNRLSLKVSQSSVNVLTELPYIITKYALLTHMLAHVLNMDAYEFIWDSGIAYYNLKEEKKVFEQLKRSIQVLPKLKLDTKVKSIYDFTINDIKFTSHVSHPNINYMD